MIKFRVSAEGAMTVKKRDANTAVRLEYLEVGKTWHKKHRRRHFTLDGARRYRYAKRKPSYNKQKRKRKGHTLPLVFSGVSRLLSSQVSNLRATRRGVAITMPISVFNYKTAGSAVDKLREFRTISADEITTYESQMSRNLDRRISRHRRQQEEFG